MSPLSMPLKRYRAPFSWCLISFTSKTGDRKSHQKNLVSSDEHSQNLDLSSFQCFPTQTHSTFEQTLQSVIESKILLTTLIFFDILLFTVF